MLQVFCSRVTFFLLYWNNFNGKTVYAFLIFFSLSLSSNFSNAGSLYAGVAKTEISDRSGPVNDPAFVKALVLKRGSKMVVLVTLDVVALGEIGTIQNSFMKEVTKKLEEDLSIDSKDIVISASHSHSIVRQDVAELTIKTVKSAFKKLTPVMVGSGFTLEYRISENRRIKLKDGSDTDVRHAYALPSDDQMVSVGTIDPNVGVVRIDTTQGKPFAVLYNFTAHPILGVPSGTNTADYPGFASKTIEDTLGNGVISFFLQGASGDVNPRKYKDIHQSRDAEPMGERLAVDVLRAWRQIKVKNNSVLDIMRESFDLPLTAVNDFKERIEKNQTSQKELLASLTGTSLDLRSFIELYTQHAINPNYPSASKYRYLQEDSIGLSDLANLDAEKIKNMKVYLKNVYIMEQLTRLKANLDLLKKHEAKVADLRLTPFKVDVVGIRIGDLRIVTFPGELSVDVGLSIKKQFKENSVYIVGYTNGYIYYTPTAGQKQNIGFAQEDCDSIVSPEWQSKFEASAIRVLNSLH